MKRPACFPPEPAPRAAGVYEEDYTRDGARVLYAVNARGEWLGEYAVRNRAEYMDAWAQLDALVRRPPLTLVRGAAAPRSSSRRRPALTVLLGGPP